MVAMLCHMPVLFSSIQMLGSFRLFSVIRNAGTHEVLHHGDIYTSK
jgi:hypothetical protein